MAGGIEKVWDGILERLGTRLPVRDVNELFRPLRPLALTPAQLRLEAPNRLTVLCLNDRYLEPLREAVASVVGPRQVLLEIAPTAQGELFPEQRPRRPDRRDAQAALIPRCTFGTFVVGGSNQFAHAAAMAVARQPGDHYNPLFVYGGVGLGKTHLANAIGHDVLVRRPDARVVYLSSGTFMTDLISSLRRDKMAEFKRRFRRVDLLILDDVQLLAGRERTQEEFFHTFNALHEQRRQIVLTSDKVPRDIPDLEERLRSRFEWGLIADIQPPDLETRIAILQRKAELEGIALTPDVALFLAEHIVSNVRELEGALTRLGAQASLHHQSITLEYARETLQVLLGGAPVAVTFDAILDCVCRQYSLRPSDVQSRRRSTHVALPRQVAMYLCRRLLRASFPRIGELFHRDHSTVLHAVNAIERRIKGNLSFQLTVERLEQSLRQEHA